MIQDKVELLDFNFDQFGGDNTPSDEDMGAVQQFVFKLDSSDDFDMCNRALADIGDEKTQAFISLCRKHLGENDF